MGLSDSLARMITVTPLGEVVVRHDDIRDLSVLDGYNITHLPSPSPNSLRVVENKNGQYWTLDANGIYLMQSGNWILYPVSYSSEPNRAKPLATLQAGERSCLGVSSPRDYFESNFRLGWAQLVLNARESGLGSFTDLANGFGWFLVGLRPVGCDEVEKLGHRKTRTASVGRLTLRPRNFKLPIFSIFFHRMAIVSIVWQIPNLQESAWWQAMMENGKQPKALEGKVRRAWHISNGSLMVQSFTALAMLDLDNRETVLKDSPLVAPLFDLVVETNRCFFGSALPRG